VELKNKDLEETIKQREQTFKEASKTQKELRTTKESLEAAHKKNVKLERDLAKEKKEKEKEQQVSFIYKQQVDKIQGKDDTIKTLKLKCLKSDFERKKESLIQKRQDNEMLIENLARMSNTESNSASSAAIRDAMDKLNAYSASLYSALDTLRVRYEERQQGIETAPVSNHHTEVNFEVRSVGSPNLDSLELNTLRLLTTANFNTDVRPAQVNLVMNATFACLNVFSCNLGHTIFTAFSTSASSSGKGSASSTAPLSVPGWPHPEVQATRVLCAGSTSWPRTSSRGLARD